MQQQETYTTHIIKCTKVLTAKEVEMDDVSNTEEKSLSTEEL